MRTLTFYFDYISSNAYLAWTQLEQLTAEHGLRLNVVPVLFAGLLKAHNNVGPAEIPAKRQWMAKNTLRKAALLEVPLNPPAYHPFNPLLALRASSVDMNEGQRLEFIDLLFKAAWVDRLHISDPDTVRNLAAKAGLDGDAVLTRAQSTDLAERLKSQTRDALSVDVFGVPSMLIEDELFFGYDDFIFLQNYLENADPLDEKELQKWTPDRVQPSAQRRNTNPE